MPDQAPPTTSPSPTDPASTDPAGDASPEQVASPPPRRRRRLLAAAVALLLIAAAGALGWRAWLAEQDEQAREEALRVATEAVPDVLSYDHVNLDEQFAEARRHLTSEFAVEYDELAEKTIRPTARQYQAAVSAEVVSGGVERADRDSAQVLLFVNQTTLTSELPAPRVDQSRVRVRLEHTDGRWRVSAVEPL